MTRYERWILVYVGTVDEFFSFISLFFLSLIPNILTKQFRWSTLKLDEIYEIAFEKYTTSIYMNDVFHEKKKMRT